MLLIAAIIGLGVAGNISRKKKEKERTQALELLAEELGWDFESTATDTIPGIERLALFDLGDDGEIKNLMYGEVDGVNARVFDYLYTVGFKNPTTYIQSVVLFEFDDQRFPVFTLRSEGAFDKMFSAFGYQDIDFPDALSFPGNTICAVRMNGQFGASLTIE